LKKRFVERQKRRESFQGDGKKENKFQETIPLKGSYST